MTTPNGRLAAGHPAVGTPCHTCRRPILAGDEWAFLEIGPMSAEEAGKAAAGEAYTARCVLIHPACGRPHAGE